MGRARRLLFSVDREGGRKSMAPAWNGLANGKRVLPTGQIQFAFVNLAHTLLLINIQYELTNITKNS